MAVEGNGRLANEGSPLTESQEKELFRLTRFYWREAGKCAKVEAYFPSDVMLGAWAEAVLLIFSNAYFEEIQAAALVPRNNNGTPKPLLEWTRAELLAIAKRVGWLPASLFVRGRRRKVGQYAEQVWRISDLVHPARYLRDGSRQRITKGSVIFAFDVAFAAKKWLDLKRMRP